MNRVAMIDRDSFSISENTRCAILGETVFHKSALVPENIRFVLCKCYKSVSVKYRPTEIIHSSRRETGIEYYFYLAYTATTSV